MSSLTPQTATLPLNLPDTSAIQRAYMPFILGGGLFVATTDTLPLGSDVILEVKLMNEPTTHSLSGRVVWLTPTCAQDGRTAGIGVQLDAPASQNIAPIILTYLNDAAISAQPTDTM